MRLRAAMLLAWALVAGGCTSMVREGDRLWESGEHRAALAAYEQAGRLDPDEAEALLRRGMLRAAPESEVHDPGEARRLLAAVVERFPGTVWAQQAGLVLAGMEAREERRRLEGELATVRSRLGELETQDRELRAALELEGTKTGGLVERLQELHEESERLRAEVTRLRAELEELKAIDLERPPDL